MTVQLRFSNLTLGYDRHPAVHHLDGAVKRGALMAGVGPNGAGKSTLFKGVIGSIKPLAGRIECDGVAPQDIAYLPQVAEIDRTFPINVYDMVSMGLWRRAGLFGGIGAKQRSQIESALAAVGLTDSRNARSARSADRCNACYLRDLAAGRARDVLDEPFNAIDAKPAPIARAGAVA
jgi:zinc/manganese transport system ATP-binding protein